MKRHYIGLDVLRGIGIFSVVVLHTAFYYFDGIYDLDLSNPPLIITLIGFILMFAGLFAMISGFVHTLQTYRKVEEKSYTYKDTMTYALGAGAFVLVVAYLYFLVTGPGIIDFDSRSMDQSILVELINNGRFVWPSLERILYVDSLVMIGLNIILLQVILIIGMKWFASHKRQTWFLYGAALVVLLISLARIPLYNIYLDARDNEQYLLVLLLNWIANKNNPILPFLSFALYGGWMMRMIADHDKRTIRRIVIPNAIAYIVVGLVIYLTAEETMLERAIDYTWYGIMVFQIGLFELLILLFLRWYQTDRMQWHSKFFYRFGVAGLTIFFLEQLVSSAFKRVLIAMNPDLFLGIPISIVLGLVLAVLYGLFLIWWQRHDYRYGLEHAYVTWMKRLGGSEKAVKLKADE